MDNQPEQGQQKVCRILFVGKGWLWRRVLEPWPWEEEREHPSAASRAAIGRILDLGGSAQDQDQEPPA